MLWILFVAALAACPVVAAQDSKNVIVVAGRAGVVEVIDPATLETLGRIHFEFPDWSVGLNGVSVSADGSRLYVEGPVPSDPHGCCSLYSVDLATLQTKVVASIGGSTSRDSFVFSDGLVYPAAALLAGRAMPGMRNSRLHLSPDGRWLFGVRSFRGPALDVYDLVRGELVRELTPPRLEGDWWPSGTWAGERFYFYATTSNGPGRLWTVLPEAMHLGEGVAIAEFGQVPNCSVPAVKRITATGGRVFIHELFGYKLDRRSQCGVPAPGGAWMVDPATGSLLSQVAADAHFSALMGDRTGSVLYGLASGKLLMIDARDGRVVKSRAISADFSRMAIAPIRVVPTGDVRAVQ